MTRRKVTLSLDPNVYGAAEQLAHRDGLSASAWINRAIRNETIRLGFAGSDDGGQAAFDDEVAHAAAEEDRAAR